jgi:hypothetical protein
MRRIVAGTEGSGYIDQKIIEKTIRGFAGLDAI